MRHWTRISQHYGQEVAFLRPEFGQFAQIFIEISSVPKMDRPEATEDSPLLRQHESAPNAGDVNAARNGSVKPAEDEESQRDSREEATQYPGMPEVKAKLAYILPAISIGVCRF